MTSKPHTVRTAAEPRQNALYPVRISLIDQISRTVRIFRLALPESADDKQELEFKSSPVPFCFLPGQWLDVHIPGVPQAGGFTITSSPKDALLGKEQSTYPYIELAVQNTPNPAAKWLWRPKEEILDRELHVRVGGSFTWPPRDVRLEEIRNIIFVAGGVGINPIMSILAHIYQNLDTLPQARGVHVFYSARVAPTFTPTSTTATTHDKSLTISEHLDEHVLFIHRLREIVHSQKERVKKPGESTLPLDLQLYITNLDLGIKGEDLADITIHNRRIPHSDLRQAIGDDGLDGTVCYVCGPPSMTDEFVEILDGLLKPGADGKKCVYYEKWW